MEVQKVSLSDFTRGMATDDLIAAAMGTTPQEPAAPQEPLNPLKSTDEILKTLEGTTPEDAKDAPKDPEDGDDSKNSVNPEGQQADGKKPGRPSNKLPEQFSDIIKVAEDKGLLKGFEDGKYETVDDFIALIEANKQIEKEEFKETVQKELLDSFSPAMKAVLNYAQMGAQEPQDLIPFITAVDNLQYTTELNPEDPGHQLEIIRNALMVQGLSKEAAMAEIQDLQSLGQDRLAARAKTLKPILDQYNKKQVDSIYAAQKQKQEEDIKFWKNHAEEVRNTLVSKDNISGLKLKKDHKQMIFATIAYPDPNLGDLPIYGIIDNLVRNKDFETLAEIALVALDKKAHRNYLSSEVSAAQAESHQRALRTQTKGGPTDLSGQTQQPQKIKRNDVFSRPSL